MMYIGGKDVDCQYLESTYCIHDVSLTPFKSYKRTQSISRAGDKNKVMSVFTFMRL